MTKYYKSNYYDYPIEVDNIGGEVIISIIDTTGRKIIYSWYDLISKNTESRYITKSILGGLIHGIPKNVLILGFGGGAYAKYIEDHFINIDITGVDIDNTMFKIANDELKIKTKNLILDTDNLLISQLIEKKYKYDLIFIDVYGKQGIIPKEYLNIQKYEQISKILNTNGVLTINFADYSGINIGKYNKIHYFLKKIFGENFIHINAEKGKKGNIVGVYNLDKKYTSDEINLNYLNLVKNKGVLYDSNIIKNVYVDNL